jgi:hypothetical protein
VGCNTQGALSSTPSSAPQSSINIERKNGKEPINVVREPLGEKLLKSFENINVL